jgi:hypothetical protein
MINDLKPELARIEVKMEPCKAWKPGAELKQKAGYHC